MSSKLLGTKDTCLFSLGKNDLGKKYNKEENKINLNKEYKKIEENKIKNNDIISLFTNE
jgi:hypothetical protein